LNNKLKSFITNDLLMTEEEVHSGDDLFSLGLSSMRLMRLIAFLEDTYQIHIKPEEVIPDNFKSIGKITELLERKKSGAITQI
jgi:acyl carrier protein